MFRKNHGNRLCVTRELRGLALLTVLSIVSPQVLAATLGMVADNSGDQIRIFDARTDAITLEIASLPGSAVGDCAVSSDELLGFTTNSSRLISFIDLQQGTAGVAEPSNTRISNLGVDMSLSPDNRFLVSAGGGAIFQPLSVIDTRSRLEVSAQTLFADHTSVEFCDNGTLLVTTTHGTRYGTTYDNALYDVSVGEDASLMLAGNRISANEAQPNNSACAPGSGAGVMLDRNGGLTSFTLPGLKPAAQLKLQTDFGLSAVFNDRGTRLYVRTGHTVEAFDFDPRSGEMKADWVRTVAESSSYFGMDQMAINPEGGRLYVDGGREMLILDPLTGAEQGTIATGDATGVCFARAPVEADHPLAATAITMAAAPPP